MVATRASAGRPGAITIDPLIVIVGETASGKSQLSLHLAQRFNGEIICADSWTVRREVTIGTAKPTAAEQALVPHHLVDVVGPDDEFTAAVFQRLAREAISNIANRGKVPVMVGGTGLYIDSVIYEYSFLPAGDRVARKNLDSLSIDVLLNQIDEAGIALGEVDVRNKRRLIRLLETDGAKPKRSELRPNTLLVGLQPDRTTLEQRIKTRTHAMIANGLEEEVRSLIAHYGWDCEGLKGIGYAQWRPYVEGRVSISQVETRINKATRDLAKRQRTWFKRNKSIHWLHTPVDQPALEAIVTTFLS